MARQRFQLRRDTAGAWSSTNPVLLSGECGYETDTRLLKVGDGTTAWNALGYVVGGIDQLVDLADVDAATPVDGSVLTYDEGRAMFVAGPLDTRLTLTDGGNF